MSVAKPYFKNKYQINDKKTYNNKGRFTDQNHNNGKYASKKYHNGANERYFPYKKQNGFGIRTKYAPDSEQTQDDDHFENYMNEQLQNGLYEEETKQERSFVQQLRDEPSVKNDHVEPSPDLMLNVSYEPIVKPTKTNTDKHTPDKKNKSKQKKKKKMHKLGVNPAQDDSVDGDASIEEVTIGIKPCVDGPHQKVDEGTVLRLNKAKFGRVPTWVRKNQENSAKRSYKHLIKGDILVMFKNTNLHEIEGYAVKRKT